MIKTTIKNLGKLRVYMGVWMRTVLEYSFNKIGEYKFKKTIGHDLVWLKA